MFVFQRTKREWRPLEDRSCTDLPWFLLFTMFCIGMVGPPPSLSPPSPFTPPPAPLVITSSLFLLLFVPLSFLFHLLYLFITSSSPSLTRSPSLSPPTPLPPAVPPLHNHSYHLPLPQNPFLPSLLSLPPSHSSYHLPHHRLLFLHHILLLLITSTCCCS